MLQRSEFIEKALKFAKQKRLCGLAASSSGLR